MIKYKILRKQKGYSQAESGKTAGLSYVMNGGDKNFVKRLSDTFCYQN